MDSPKILWCWRNHPIRCRFLGSELASFHQRDFLFFHSPHRLYEWWSRGIWLMLLFFRADEKGGRKKRARTLTAFLFIFGEPSWENVRDVNSEDRERERKNKHTVRERRILLLLHFLERERKGRKKKRAYPPAVWSTAVYTQQLITFGLLRVQYSATERTPVVCLFSSFSFIFSLDFFFSLLFFDSFPDFEMTANVFFLKVSTL